MIHIMIGGRLKEPAKGSAKPPLFVIERTTAVMLATDGANRSQKVLLETTDPDIGRTLRNLKDGTSITVTGEATFVGVGTLQVRVRTVQSFKVNLDAAPLPASDKEAPVSPLGTLRM